MGIIITNYKVTNESIGMIIVGRKKTLALKLGIHICLNNMKAIFLYKVGDYTFFVESHLLPRKILQRMTSHLHAFNNSDKEETSILCSVEETLKFSLCFSLSMSITTY